LRINRKFQDDQIEVPRIYLLFHKEKPKQQLDGVTMEECQNSARERLQPCRTQRPKIAAHKEKQGIPATATWLLCLAQKRCLPLTEERVNWRVPENYQHSHWPF
jgi:hypothetical protein